MQSASGSGSSVMKPCPLRQSLFMKIDLRPIPHLSEKAYPQRLRNVKTDYTQKMDRNLFHNLTVIKLVHEINMASSQSQL